MSKNKGKRREREARSALESVGYAVETPNATKYQREDFFNLFDIIAIHQDRKPMLIQVKSNVARGINDFALEVNKKIPSQYFRVQYWVCYDRKGWRIINVESGQTEEVYDGRSQKGNMLDNLEQYVSSIEEQHQSG